MELVQTILESDGPWVLLSLALLLDARRQRTKYEDIAQRHVRNSEKLATAFDRFREVLACLVKR